MQKFQSVKEMVCWLIDNPESELKDSYGRRWKYQRFEFWFKDIGDFSVYTPGLFCLHLFGTVNNPSTQLQNT